MSRRVVYLISKRMQPSVRAHFAIYVPSGDFPGVGTLIHVVGAPMAGFQLEINESYSLESTGQRYTAYSLGDIPVDGVEDLCRHASRIPPPPISKNFMAPVDGIINKRCQEWTFEFVDLLTRSNTLPQQALRVIQSQRDPPNHGIGLKKVVPEINSM